MSQETRGDDNDNREAESWRLDWHHSSGDDNSISKNEGYTCKDDDSDIRTLPHCILMTQHLCSPCYTECPHSTPRSVIVINIQCSLHTQLEL